MCGVFFFFFPLREIEYEDLERSVPILVLFYKPYKVFSSTYT